MANVRNNHSGRLTVAGVSIRPGATVRIEGWSEDLADAREKVFLADKLIEVVPEPDDEDGKAKSKKP